jgi:2-polyprenyl-6-hydroxyphenyl methylase / 3-demethylubiquinone-9 3-methyltransferase
MTETSVNNEIYREMGHAWWDDDVGEFSTIRFFVNPVRTGFFLRMIERECVPDRAKLLDIGCGGGILAEEFARVGFRVTGVDPAPETIATAKAHATTSGLSIDYAVGSGEQLPFADESFRLVACCDVLEHVDDVERVVSEVARVLEPGGLFLYDTINRTFLSKLVIIKAMQEWPSVAFAAPNTHVWEKFIKPAELIELFERHHLGQREIRGIESRANIVANWLDLRRRAKGLISFKELGQRLRFREGPHLEVSYMGYAVKGGRPRQV